MSHRPLLIKGGRMVDPSQRLDGVRDLLLTEGRVAAVGDSLEAPADARVLDATGLVVTPGLIDVHVHLREPGQEHKETIASGASYPNFRNGFTNLAAGETFTTSWMQNLPALGSLVGANTWTLEGYDVTPAPYNQPPYAPSGDMDSSACTVTGIHP